jgi:hypothetical protein
MSPTVPVWRVLAWNPVQMAWTVRSSHDDVGDAAEEAEALRRKDKRLRVMVVGRRVMRGLAIKPPVNNATRAWRLDRAGRMSDLADAAKRYKSPG